MKIEKKELDPDIDYIMKNETGSSVWIGVGNLFSIRIAKLEDTCAVHVFAQGDEDAIPLGLCEVLDVDAQDIRAEAGLKH